jgi:FtsP/CotA-like multicopper oxidase with cupredoxin domain
MDLVTSIVRALSLIYRLKDAYPLQHWHGMFQKHTNYADGGAFVNQCPIVPKESFDYIFNSENQAAWPSLSILASLTTDFVF